MKIFKNGSKFCLDFRFRDKRFRIIAFENENASNELGRTLKRLMDIYQSNDAMPLELQRAVDCMPLRIVRRLGSIGLLSDARVAGKNRLEDHLNNFMDSLKVKRCSERHLSLVESMIKRICEKCKFDCLSDLDANRFTAFVNSLNTAVKTKRHYIAVFKQFTKWLSETGKLSKNNFKLIKTPKVLQSDQIHARRALTADEVARLISAAENGKPFRGISGTERALIYRLAVESGLRYNEIKTLKVSDFDFANCTVQIRDVNEKARRGAILPLRQSTADKIRLFLSNKTPQATAFTLKKGYMMIRRDLAATVVRDEKGKVLVEAVPYVVDGKFADFHCLRHSAATLLIQTGANPKVIQSLMRHTDINLTLSKYSHLYAGQQRETIESLPNFIFQQAKFIKTGTDDCVAAEPPKTGENVLSKNCPKSANQSEKKRTIRNDLGMAITLRNRALDALKRRESPFLSEKQIPAFLDKQSGRQDLNLRPLAPHASALAKLRHAPIDYYCNTKGCFWQSICMFRIFCRLRRVQQCFRWRYRLVYCGRCRK